MFGSKSFKRDEKVSKAPFWSFGSNGSVRSQNSLRSSDCDNVFPHPRPQPETAHSTKRGFFKKSEKEIVRLHTEKESLDEKTFYLSGLSPVNERFRAFDLLMEQEEAFEVDLRLIQDMLGTLSNLEVAGVDQIQGLSTILDAMLSCSRIVLGKVKYIPSQLLEQWLWKTLSENFIKYFAIAESFMEALVQDALGLRDETLSIDQIVNLLLKPFVRPMWYRFFLQHIVSNVPNPTEDLLFALTYARSMTAKALEAKRLTHYDHFDEIIALENMFDASTCQSLDGSKTSTKFTTFLSKPITFCFSAIPFSQRHVLSASFREVVWNAKKGEKGVGEDVRICVLTCVMLVAKVDDGGKYRLMFPPVPIRDVGMNEYPPLPGMSNVLEIKISQTNLLVLQAHTEKDKQDLLSIHALIQTNEWDQTPDAVHSLLSHPAPSTTTLVEETPPAVCELFKELCRPFLKTTEWEKLPKAFMYVVAELDGTRPRIVFSNETTYRELGHLGISVSTTMIESDPKSVILSAYPVNSKAMAQYLIRFKDSTICNRFKDEVNKAAANVTQFIYKSRQSSLLIESPSSLPTLLDLTCPTLTFTSIDVTSFSPQKASDLGAARVVVKGEDEKVVVEITSTVNKDVTWLCSNVLDETFKVEEGGDKTLGRSSDSIMTMDSLTVARPVGYSITLVFATSSEKRYKLTFPAATPSVKSLLKLLDRPFTSPSINTPPVITHTSSSTPRLATSPGRTATGLLAARHVKSTGDLASSAVSTSRGVTGWVAERVAYFNELARRSAGVGRGGVVRPVRSGKVLERWVAAMEAVKEEERGKEKGRVEKGGIEMCRSEKIGKDDGYKKNVEEDVNQSGMKSGNSVVVEVGDVECVREFEHSKNVVVEALTMKMKQVDNMVEEVDMQCLKEIEQVDMSCLKEIKQAEDVVEESVLHSDKDGVEISVATEEEIYQEDFDSTLKSDIKLVHVDQDTPDSDDLNNTTMISQLDLPIDYITNVTEDDSAPTSTTENPPEKLSTPSLLSPQPLLPSLHPDVPVAAELTLPKDPTALISTLLALYPPFTGTTATSASHYLTTRWHTGPSDPREKLLPHDDFPAQVKQVWESMPYTVQYILVKIGLESKDAGMVARAWLNIDRTNLEKVNPDYVVSRPAHIQGPSM